MNKLITLILLVIVVSSCTPTEIQRTEREQMYENQLSKQTVFYNIATLLNQCEGTTIVSTTVEYKAADNVDRTMLVILDTTGRFRVYKGITLKYKEGDTLKFK